MESPLEVTFRNLPHTPELERLIGEEVDRLHRFAAGIVGTRVALEQEHEQASGSPYRIRLEVTLPPHKDLVVTRNPGDYPHNATLDSVIRNTFHVMERRIKRAAQKRRGEVKDHASTEQRALVVRAFPEKGYGFLKTTGGRELYFHRNSVLHGDFDRLVTGTEVRFVEGMGEDGPQASTVQIVNKPGARATGESPLERELPPGWRR